MTRIACATGLEPCTLILIHDVHMRKHARARSRNSQKRSLVFFLFYAATGRNRIIPTPFLPLNVRKLPAVLGAYGLRPVPVSHKYTYDIILGIIYIYIYMHISVTLIQVGPLKRVL
jgi:hypothetical protein